MCMESKAADMGLPAGVVTSTATATTAATNNGNSEPAPTRPDHVTMPTISTDTGPCNTGIPFPLSTAPNPSPLNSTLPPYMPNMSTAIVPISSGSFSFINPSAPSGFESMKKKRGRPRKYGPEGSLALTVTPLSALAPSPSSPSQKRGRGRPPGSGKNQQLAALGELMLGSIGAGFTPHAITVATGEDIASRIMSFSQQGPRGICILSANGAVSSVTLRQPSISGGIVTYEGRFEILSLSGSFLLSEYGGARSRTGGLSVSLAGPDGRVVGGGVAGVLIAASPVQVVVGSFLCNSKKLLPKPARTESYIGLARPMVSNVTKPNLQVNAGNIGLNLSTEAKLESKVKVAESPAHVVQPEGTTVSSNSGSPATADVHDKEMPPKSVGSEAAIEEKHVDSSNADQPES